MTKHNNISLSKSSLEINNLIDKIPSMDLNSLLLIIQRCIGDCDVLVRLERGGLYIKGIGDLIPLSIPDPEEDVKSYTG